MTHIKIGGHGLDCQFKHVQKATCITDHPPQETAVFYCQMPDQVLLLKYILHCTNWHIGLNLHVNINVTLAILETWEHARARFKGESYGAPNLHTVTSLAAMLWLPWWQNVSIWYKRKSTISCLLICDVECRRFTLANPAVWFNYLPVLLSLINFLSVSTDQTFLNYRSMW